MQEFVYPPSPANFDEALLNPSANFKKQVGRVIVLIAFFFVVYLLLVIAAVALALALFYIGLHVMFLGISVFTLAGGLGLIAIGLSVLYFLVKFIFSVSKNQKQSRVEMKEEDQPELFEFIRKLSAETKTPFPKKIYISPDVNACVFYNSSFWSMFFPVRKNLEIGLGLVNAINISELKAVIAHEFGHFSQRSMKLGSFTYQVNTIIYNMLFDNKGYTSFLNAWGQVHAILGLCANLTASIARGIQYLLREMYKVVNKGYMALSREMEFHADAVAASAAGGNNLISGLSKLDLAQTSYQAALNRADEKLKEKLKTGNIFSDQLSVYKALGNYYHLGSRNGMPEVTYDFVRSMSQSRINYKDQWASHPSVEERKISLDKITLEVAPDETSAWVIFKNAQLLQQQLTENLYNPIEGAKTYENVQPGIFEKEYNEGLIENKLPEVYKGYYDKRFVDIATWNIEDIASGHPQTCLRELYSEELVKLPASLQSNMQDLEIVKAIKEKKIDTATFDFDGTKYKSVDAGKIEEQLQKEIHQQEMRLNENDKKAFAFFANTDPLLKIEYKKFKDAAASVSDFEHFATNMMGAMNDFGKGNLTLELVRSMVTNMKNNHESRIRNFIQGLINDGTLSETQNTPAYKLVKEFLAVDYRYFVGNSFMNDEFNKVHSVMLAVLNVLTENKFRAYKTVLNRQAESYKNQYNETLHCQ